MCLVFILVPFLRDQNNGLPLIFFLKKFAFPNLALICWNKEICARLQQTKLIIASNIRNHTSR